MSDVPGRVLVGGTEHRLELLDYRPGDDDRPARIRIRLDSRELQAQARALGRGRWLVALEGKSVLVRVAPGGRERWVGQGGCATLIRPQDARPAEALPGQITPSMPAVVVKVLVSEGQRVRRGQDLVVIAAMKLETTLVSPRNGVVASIAVGVGDKVKAGQVLCQVTEEEATDGQ